MKRTVGMVVLACMLVATPAWAMRTRVHEAAESDRYGRKAGGMVGRGALNVVTFFMDTFVNIVEETKSGPPVVGTLTGLGKGLGCSALRLGSGTVDIVTFWVPGFNGFPVSDSYANCLGGHAQDAATSSPTAAPRTSPAKQREK